MPEKSMTKVQSWSRCFLFLAAALTACPALANTGVCEGSGHTIKLIHSEDVEMQSEDVTIVPGRGPFLFNGSTMDRVGYRCKFVLHNRSKKLVTIQVGFPLTAQFMKPPYEPEEYDATDLVLDYKFIVRDNEKTYHVRFVPYDKDKKLASIFLWDMSFQTGETRTLNVAYEIPMSVGRSRTDKSGILETHYSKDWYYALTPCVGESFEYVTITGQSWAGPIKNAKFNLYVEGFEQYLANRFIVERPPLTKEERAALEKAAKEEAEEVRKSLKEESKDKPPISGAELDAMVGAEMRRARFDWHVKDCLIHREIGPPGWRGKDGMVSWDFKNYHPKESLQVTYRLTLLPKTPEGVPSLIKQVLGSKPTKEDLSDLREIYLAWWGVRPNSKAVREFVSNQYWYSPKTGMTAEKLTAEQKAVISAIERYSAKTRSP